MRTEQGEESPKRMHTYSTDNDLRLRIAAGLGIVSYLTVEWFPVLDDVVARVFLFSIEPTAPTLGIVLTLTTVVFSKWIWNTWPVRALGLVQVPDLNGKWSGQIVSSYHESTDNGGGIPVEVTIEQSWRKITVEFETEDSHSYSLGASFITSQSDPQLHYHYQSVPKPHAENTLEMHRGSTEIRFIDGEDGEDTLEGRYYAGRGRENHGRIELTRDG